MTSLVAAVVSALAVAAAGGGLASAGRLPVCGNRKIQQVVKRVGCTVGDTRCWYRSGGYCTDHVDGRLAAARRGGGSGLVPVPIRVIQPGDVAAFRSRAHYAYVERVLRDKKGEPIAVEVTEKNFGNCWVDEGAMVTERYGEVTRRRVEVADVDGGFLRAAAAAR